MNIPPLFPRALAISSIVTLLLILGYGPSVFGQGAIVPSGTPAPIFKTLQQVEPRIDLQNAPTSAVTTSDANYHYIITQPGSYYLSANISVTKNNGIKINAESVTLDLNGFEISHSAGSGSGIEIASGMHRATVRNGSIRAMLTGILDSGSRGGRFSNLSLSGCTAVGLDLGLAATVESCTVVNGSGSNGIALNDGSSIVGSSVYSGNFTGAAILAGPGSTINRCNASGNTGTAGIQTGGSCLVVDCITQMNTNTASASGGISATTNCSVIRCAALGNTSSSGILNATTGYGIQAGAGSTIQNCVASGNKGDGFRIAGASFVSNNHADNNGFGGGDGAGIHVFTAGDSRIDNNSVTNNDRGIDIDTAGNLIIKNSASGNGPANYDIVADNRYGEIIDLTATGTAAATGNAAPTTLTSAGSWANFAY